MPKHSSFPFTFTGWDEAGDYGDIQFYGVEFTDVFGPIKEGDKFDTVVRVDAKGVLETYDREGNKLLEIPILYVPAEAHEKIVRLLMSVVATFNSMGLGSLFQALVDRANKPH